ncbi:hypothetical protein SETIT_4G122100v2 [Setaria italica]|uniref:NADH dehydrogenase [ubiquinone] 1 beta subcomplex subunit 3 n=1 Tax=Setaria italica TaxID=4555 RepID=K3Y1C2_SETIT|nr:hypothetical protein SETIT_4G122100v2 [Setaria italica]
MTNLGGGDEAAEPGLDALLGDVLVEGVPSAPTEVVDDARELLLGADLERLERGLGRGDGGGERTRRQGEFFRRRYEWMRRPIVGNQLRHATPGLGIAIVAFGIYLIGEAAYNRVYRPSGDHHH